MKRALLTPALVASSILAATPPASARTDAGAGITAGGLVRSAIDWVPVAGPTGDTHIGFHIRWRNPDSTPSGAINGSLHSQHFGVFLG